MPPLPSPPYRLDLWTDVAAAGGTRIAFLVEGSNRAATNLQRARYLDAGRSQLTFDVAPDYEFLTALAPRQGVVRLTHFVPSAPDTFSVRVEEWRVTRRVRTLRGGVGVYQITCVPIEEDLLDFDVWREVSDGGLPTWRYGAVDRTPSEVLGDLADRATALGRAWLTVGTVTPTTPVTIDVGLPTFRSVIDAVIAALAAQGVTAEFQLTLAGDLSAYRMELVTAVAGALAPLRLTTGVNALDVTYTEDALEQATTVIPFGEGGIDLREFQCELQAVDGATGWCTLRALGGAAALLVAVDGQYTGKRLFRESTGRSFAITDASASPPRVRLATADLASGLAAGERVSLRETEDLAGERRHFATPAKYSPAEVVSTLTSPARINTRDLADTGDWIGAANELRDWFAERSQLVAALPAGDFDHVAGTLVLDSAPSAAPQADDWVWFSQGGGLVPGTVVSYVGGTRTLTLRPRYRDQSFTTSLTNLTGARCYRPVGTPMWIQASQVTSNQLQVDALSGPSFTATDVLELVQRCQGTRVVELTDPGALAVSPRKVATLEVPEASGAVNRVPNWDLAAWAGASGDPPDGWTITNIVGTVTRARSTDPLYTRYGGKSWRITAAAGASFVLRSPLIPVHAVPGAAEVAAGVAVLFTRFTGAVPLVVTVSAVTAAGVRTALGVALRIYPPDTTVNVDAALKAALEQWYDGVLTNRSISALGAEQLQLEIERPAGASNPACEFYLDAAILLHRPGLLQASGGGVRWVGDDALRLMSRGNEALLDRAAALQRFEVRLFDLFGIDGLRYPDFEAVPGRQVTLTLSELGLTRSVRLLGVRGSPDTPETLVGEFDRVRADVTALLAAAIAPPTVVPPTLDEPPVLVATLDVAHSYDDDFLRVTVQGGPVLQYSYDNGVSWGTLTAYQAHALTYTRPSSASVDRVLRFRASSGRPGDVQEVSVLNPRKVYLPPTDPQITAINVTNEFTPCDGGGSIDLGYTAANMPGTETIDWSATVLSGGGGGATSDSGSGVAPGAFPVTAALGLCPGAQVRLTVAALVGGVEIASYETTVTLP